MRRWKIEGGDEMARKGKPIGIGESNIALKYHTGDINNMHSSKCRLKYEREVPSLIHLDSVN